MAPGQEAEWWCWKENGGNKHSIWNSLKY